MRWFKAASIIFFSLYLFVASVSASGKISPLVDVEWLQQNMKRPDLVLLDIRSPRSTRNFYVEGHIPGAVAAPYNEGWRKTINGVIGMLPPVEEISEHIGNLGVDETKHVVILPFGVSSTDFSAATRIYWTFKVLGHDSVSILDGGYSAWIGQGLGLSDVAILPGRAEFKPEFRPELVASEGDVKRLHIEDVNLVDARPKAQFEGKAKSPVVLRAGTIPGAQNLQQSSLYQAKKAKFTPKLKIDEIFEQREISSQKPTITFCNTGHWASIAWFAMSEIAGHDDVALYDGSMAEWTASDENPVE